MKKGFTLIELLVVVLIIGILAAIAVPQYQKAVMKSRFATLKHLTRSIAEAEERYYLANGQYTKKLDNLDIKLEGDSLCNDNICSYPWGQCEIYDTWAKCQLNKNDTVILAYKIMFNFVESAAGEIQCFAYNFSNPNDIQNVICQNETGKTNPNWYSNNYHAYTYP